MDLLKKDYDQYTSKIDEIEMIVYNKKSDQPNIFDEIQNKIADIVRWRRDLLFYRWAKLR